MRVSRRQKYLDKLIASRDSDQVKVVTGIRRCGETFLLFDIFKSYLANRGLLFRPIANGLTIGFFAKTLTKSRMRCYKVYIWAGRKALVHPRAGTFSPPFSY